MCLNVFQRKDQSLDHASRLRLNSMWSFCARRPPLTHQEYIIYRESGNASLLVWMHVKSCVELICITHYHIQCLRGLYRCTAATVPDPARQSEGDFTPMLLRAIETKQRGSRPTSKCTRRVCLWCKCEVGPTIRGLCDSIDWWHFQFKSLSALHNPSAVQGSCQGTDSLYDYSRPAACEKEEGLKRRSVVLASIF